MTIAEAQFTVDEWIKKYGVRYFSELTNMAILTEEVGEVARLMSRQYGDQSFKESDKADLGDELAGNAVLLCRWQAFLTQAEADVLQHAEPGE